MLIKLALFSGEVPRLPAHLLPDNAASFALNCDFLHGELQGHRDWSIVSPLPQFQGSPMVSIWTENGADFFGWPYEVVAWKSPVINDPHHRIYYAAVPEPGPVLKVARTKTPEGIQVINGQVPNFNPPEILDPFIDGLESWLLGVPKPQAQNTADTDTLDLTLFDLPEWPLMPRLQLRVTYFLEDTAGAIVWQTDITNLDTATDPNTGQVKENIFFTDDSAVRDTGNKMQDMLWPLGYAQRPYKFYWFNPPDTSNLALSRTVTITNTDPSNNPYVITFSDQSTTPPPTDTTPPPNDQGTQGGEA